MHLQRKIVVIYIVLTLIKFFTAEIYTQREEDPTIYFKPYPTVSNIFLGSDIHHTEYRRKYTWFEKGCFWEICHGNSVKLVSYIYRTIIFLWWVLSAYLIGIGLYFFTHVKLRE